jgi:hypothetical protein
MKHAKQKQIESNETHHIQQKHEQISSIGIYLTSFIHRNVFAGLNV